MRQRLSQAEAGLRALEAQLSQAGNKQATVTQRVAAEVAATLSVAIAVPVGGVKFAAHTVEDIVDVLGNNGREFAAELVWAYTGTKARVYAQQMPNLIPAILAGSQDAAVSLFLQRYATLASVQVPAVQVPTTPAPAVQVPTTPAPAVQVPTTPAPATPASIVQAPTVQEQLNVAAQLLEAAQQLKGAVLVGGA